MHKNIHEVEKIINLYSFIFLFKEVKFHFSRLIVYVLINEVIDLC